ncbi:hypothetical protein DYH55_02560 [Methylovirgula sp. 4M-Z18]|nr:hypothetical protein DYH55_02560 [Methylovirgula sp. 4M-Z18]
MALENKCQQWHLNCTVALMLLDKAGFREVAFLPGQESHDLFTAKVSAVRKFVDPMDQQHAFDVAKSMFGPRATGIKEWMLQ